MAERPKILIVDDKVENLIALEKVLADVDAGCIRALSGNEALKQLLVHEVAMVLMDVQMPGMDGYETVELMRQDKRLRTIPVIYLSAVYKEEDHKLRAAEVGAVDFLTKPILPAVLKSKAEIFLKLYENRVAMAEEIEHRKQVERHLRGVQEELEEANRTLDRKVRERTQELTVTNEALVNEIGERKLAEATLKEAQAKIVETEKIAAIGTLTAGIAHEMNNPLMGILNFIQYCLKKVPPEEKVHAVLADAETATHHCIRIVRNLLTFSRFEKEESEPFVMENPSVLFDRVLDLLSYRIEKEGIRIHRALDEQVTAIPVKVTGFQQVLLNLMGNALDSVADCEDKEIRMSSCVDNGFAVIDIADTGCGVSQENRGKIFDPFFTTKPVGKGTGLGLSVSSNIIKQHGGSLSHHTVETGGSIFRIRLPMERPDAVSAGTADTVTGIDR